MNVIRLTTSEEVVKYWELFREGLSVIRAYEGESSTEQSYLKLLLELVSHGNDTWFGVVISGGPISYAVVTNSTPPFATSKTFVVSSFYHVPGQHDATFALMHAFEQWAKENDVKSYVVTTRRQSGPALHCFSSGRYGFKKSYRAFEKQL